MKKNGNRPTRKHSASDGQKAALLLSLSLGAGLGSAALLLCLFALLLTRLPIPLTAVQPMACFAVGMGSAVSGFALAKGSGRQHLLCGLACGAFYAACLLVASTAAGGRALPDTAGATLHAALILGGLLGGAVSAVRAS